MGQALAINPVVTISDVRCLPAGSDVLFAGVDVALDRIEIDVGVWGEDGCRQWRLFEAEYTRSIADVVKVPVLPMSNGRPIRVIHLEELDAFPARRAASPPTTRRGRRRARGRARAARVASC